MRRPGGRICMRSIIPRWTGSPLIATRRAQRPGGWRGRKRVRPYAASTTSKVRPPSVSAIESASKGFPCRCSAAASAGSPASSWRPVWKTVVSKPRERRPWTTRGPLGPVPPITSAFRDAIVVLLSASAIASHHREAAVHRDRLAGDVARVLAQEEGHQGRHVFGAADAAQRDRAHEAVEELLAVLPDLREERSVGRPRAHAVHPDLVARHLARERLREGDHAALGGGVDRLARRADLARVGAEVHDAAAASRDHAVEHGADRKSTRLNSS